MSNPATTLDNLRKLSEKVSAELQALNLARATLAPHFTKRSGLMRALAAEIVGAEAALIVTNQIIEKKERRLHETV